MSTLIRRTSTFAAVTASLVGLIGYYALVTHLAFAAEARRLLAVHFTTVPARPGEALAIWLHNSRLVLGVDVHDDRDATEELLLVLAHDRQPRARPTARVKMANGRLRCRAGQSVLALCASRGHWLGDVARPLHKRASGTPRLAADRSGPRFR